MLKTNSKLVTKNQLLDYVSKRDFNDFVGGMYDFRDEMGAKFEVVEKRLDGIDNRLNGVDKRLNSLDRKFEELKEDMRIHTGAILDQFKEYMQINREYMQGVEERLMNKIQALEDKIN